MNVIFLYESSLVQYDEYSSNIVETDGVAIVRIHTFPVL